MAVGSRVPPAVADPTAARILPEALRPIDKVLPFAAARGTGSAADQTVRTLALALGLGGVIYCAAEIPEILTQRHAYAGWWSASAVAAVVAGNLALALAARRGVVSVRRTAAVVAFGYPALMSLLPLAMAQGSVSGTSTWICRTAVLGGLAAALALPRPAMIGFLLVSTAVETLANRYAIEDGPVSLLAEDFVRLLVTAAVFAWFVSSAVSAAATLDRVTADSKRRAAVAAAADAREQERARFAALVHDSVLSTLLDASRPGIRPGVLRRQAQRALTQLSELRSLPQALASYDATAIIELFGATTWSVDGNVPYSGHQLPGSDGLRQPADAAAAMSAALSEAVRNSVRHAPVGRPVHRAVTVTVGVSQVQVTLTDDGAGFDPLMVPPERLGIAVSILGRMRELPGGAARVESRPGHGTTVILTWDVAGTAGVR